MENVHWHPIGNLQWVEDKWSEDEPKFVRRTDRSVIHETPHPITKRTTPHMTWSVLLNTFSVWCFFNGQISLHLLLQFNRNCRNKTQQLRETHACLWEHHVSNSDSNSYNVKFQSCGNKHKHWLNLGVMQSTAKIQVHPPGAGDFTVAKKKKKIPNMFTSHQLRLFCFFQQELQEYESCQTSLTVIKDVWR